jgi:uncharacterized membrane protein
VAREQDPRLKLGDFGTFVIFAAIYAAGTLGLPEFRLLAYQLKIGEMASPFVAIFGMPAVLGLTLGQFIANVGFEVSPIAMLSPVFSFLGLLAIYYARKRSTFAGCIAYVLITGAWLSFELPSVEPGLPSSLAAISAFGDQLIAVIVGYVGYLVASRTMVPSQNTQQSPIGKTRVGIGENVTSPNE